MYQFRPASQSSKKMIVVAWVVALLLIPVFYFTVSGKSTIDAKNQELDQRLGVALEQNTIMLDDLRMCANVTDEYINALGQLNETLEIRESALNELNASFSAYAAAIEQLNASSHQCQSDLRGVIINSAKEICCGPGLSSAAFDVSGNRIICAGRYTINCTSGASDY